MALTCALCSAQTAPRDAPALSNDGWQIEAELAAAAFDAHKLCVVLHKVADVDISIHSLLVVRHGRLVAEVYRAGKDERVKNLFHTTRTLNASTFHGICFISRSVTSLLWSIAQGQGRTPPLDVPVLSLFPALVELNRDGRETITFSQILSISSGLAQNEWRVRSLSNNDELGLFQHLSQVHYMFDRPMAAPAGTQFDYNGGNMAVLALLLVECTSMSVPKYACQQLLEPPGITDWEWVDDCRGRPLVFVGVRLRPRGLVRISQLALQRGQWNGRQLVPAEWTTESTRPRIDIGMGLQYGHQRWLGKVVAGGTECVWIGGIGNSGQRL